LLTATDVNTSIASKLRSGIDALDRDVDLLRKDEGGNA